MRYATYEYVLIGISIAIAIVYSVIFRRAKISIFDDQILPIWAAIHQHGKSAHTITAIQNLRNIMTVVTLLAGAC